MTDAEQRLWSRLRRKQVNGFRFRRQVPLGRFVVDFACFEARVIVEVDGGQHADETTRDQVRDEWLASQGFRVLRFWNHGVLRETEAVVETILRALMQPPPHPSPVKGEGEEVQGRREIPPPLAMDRKSKCRGRMDAQERPGGGEGEG
jgi:very-short-patch-repair endonuclease